ncbi:MAG: tetratricopeptide repeat protein [Cyanobacteria bacterium P01_D01_bin.44]
MEIFLACVAFSLWGWMFYDCARHEYNRTNWCIAIIIFNVLGALLYCVVRWLPRHLPAIRQHRTRIVLRQQQQQLEAEARNIGKAQQFLRLGNLYRDMGYWDKALAAYQQTLDKESKNRQALWEIASLNLAQKEFAIAYEHLDQLLKIDPEFQYGDASLAYGRVLVLLENYTAAAEHFKTHFASWSHPEAYLLMAKIRLRQNDFNTARELLESMIIKVKSSPGFYYRQHRAYVDQGLKLLKTLPQSVS